MEEHKCEHNDISYPKGLKWTKQRKCVYQVLEEATEPLSAVQIYNRIEKEHEGSDYAVSTIYRILATFEEHGMVEKTTFMGDGTVVYELTVGNIPIMRSAWNVISGFRCPAAPLHTYIWNRIPEILPLPDTN